MGCLITSWLVARRAGQVQRAIRRGMKGPPLQNAASSPRLRIRAQGRSWHGSLQPEPRALFGFARGARVSWSALSLPRQLSGTVSSTRSTKRVAGEACDLIGLTGGAQWFVRSPEGPRRMRPPCSLWGVRALSRSLVLGVMRPMLTSSAMARSTALHQRSLSISAWARILSWASCFIRLN